MFVPCVLRSADEAHRLQALRPYQLVTSLSEPLFDELVRLSAALFSVPIAIIALVEESTVQFRLNVGLPAGTQQEQRAESLCSIAITQEHTTVFENLQTNPCTLAQPGFVQQLNLQFYAGHPLITPTGYPIGVLCVIDHQPRPFAAEEQQLLSRLADLTMRMLDLRVQALAEPLLSSLWDQLYNQIEDSVTRIGTLASLLQWEESAETDGARAYRQSVREEISRVLDAMQAQLLAVAC
ncbi:GAF domain-containing protein [Hymenobacter sp. BT507]|uniref:GAF domain-containing protein n=1 Tax=Hymenobacter citatus TaxID=2763506 RepID=A0ABR7MFZ8_9BACT|nr:GAF domain-containing protein [Hymenobacter citatus]MBC6609779.1 GAF domain-containing protein [Hymenobacter citatus]